MLTNKEKYLEHIRDHEQILMVRKVLDKIEWVLANYDVTVTEFLDPYQRRLCYPVIKRFFDIGFYEEGGYDEAERKAFVLFPDYLTKEVIENPICALKVEDLPPSHGLSHRDYLGAILGLGITRNKVGDILLHDTYGHILVHKELEEYLLFQLKKIGKYNVTLSKMAMKDVEKTEEKAKIVKTTVASTRLDAIVSAAYNLSRTQSATLIKAQKVKVSWEPIKQISHEVKIGDVISIRGKGRVALDEILGKTRKERLKIILKIFL